MRASLRDLVDVLTENVEYLRLLVEQLPRSQTMAKTVALERRIADLVGAYLLIRKPATRVTEPATAAWLLVRMVEHLSIQYVLEGPPISRELFVDELATMALAYLGLDASGR